MSKRKTLSVLATLLLAACATETETETGTEPTDDLSLEVDPPVLDAELVVTPTGMVNPSCVHALANDDTLDDDGNVTRADGTTYTLAACDHDTMPVTAQLQSGVVPTDNGWIEAAWWHAPRWMRRLHGNFVVPPGPTTKSTQTIFFFPSFEPASGNAIIQPVLQWGPSAAGGGKYWAIASWYVGPSRTVHGPLKRVSTGDQIFGAISGASCSGGHCTWTIETQDQTHAATSTINVKTGEVYTEVQGGVLESYKVDSCKKYPSNGVEAFFNLKVWDGNLNQVTPSFAKKFWRTTCHESQVVGSTQVFLNWH